MITAGGAAGGGTTSAVDTGTSSRPSGWCSLSMKYIRVGVRRKNPWAPGLTPIRTGSVSPCHSAAANGNRRRYAAAIAARSPTASTADAS